MENEDIRNTVEPRAISILIIEGASAPVTWRTVRLRAARVPGYDALTMGLINLSSNSPVNPVSSKGF